MTGKIWISIKLSTEKNQNSDEGVITVHVCDTPSRCVVFLKIYLLKNVVLIYYIKCFLAPESREHDTKSSQCLTDTPANKITRPPEDHGAYGVYMKATGQKMMHLYSQYFQQRVMEDFRPCNLS